MQEIVPDRPIVLPANVLPSKWEGKGRIAQYRGEPLDPTLAEDWVGSTVSRMSDPSLGATRLDDGRLLGDAVAADPIGWLGRDDAAGPGILVKLLDAGQRLPLHVHPTREFMTAQTGGVHGKTEAWIVLSAEPGSTLGVGFSRDVSLEELADWVERQDVEALTAATLRVPVAAGDVVFCPASVPHSIGDGILLVEVEEPTDLSIMLEWKGYQVDGPRNGHIGLGFDRALTAVDRSAWTPERVEELAVRRGAATVIAPGRKRLLVEAADPFFTAEEISDGAEWPAAWSIVAILSGSGELEAAHGAVPVSRGMTLLLPHGAGDAALHGDVVGVRIGEGLD